MLYRVAQLCIGLYSTSCGQKRQRQDAAAAAADDDDDDENEGVVHGNKPDIVYRGVHGSVSCGRRSASSSLSLMLRIPCIQWRRQDLLRGGAKLKIRSWSTRGGLQTWVQQLVGS